VLFLEGFLDPRLVVVSAVPGAAPVVSRAPLAEGKEFWPLCLSDDGMLVVLRSGGYARIVDTATGKDRSLPPLEAAHHCTFESPRRLVLYGLDPARGSTYRRVLDLETGAQGGRVDYPEAMGILAAHGDRLLARIRLASGSEIGLYDAESGRLLRRLGVAASWGWEPGVAFLPSGQIAFVGIDPSNTLRVFDPDGRERMTLPFADGKATLAGANAQGEVFVVLHSATSESTLVVDPETGDTKRRIEDLQPTNGPFLSDPVAQVSSSSERFRLGLFIDPHQAIVRLDPDTGQRQTILAGARFEP
jgi:WD40 repeat protein